VEDEKHSLDIGTKSRAQFDIRSADIEKRLSTEEMVHNLMLFLFAGYDTTSNALAYRCSISNALTLQLGEIGQFSA